MHIDCQHHPLHILLYEHVKHFIYPGEIALNPCELCLQELRKAAVLVFANKQDIKGSMSAAEISQQLNLTSIKDHGWHIQACCALTGEG